MANSKIEDLGALTTPVSTDVLPIVDDPAGTPITKKVTVANILAVYDSQTSTMSNKTLTAPTINTSAISGGNAENLTIGSSVASPSITATVLTVTSGGSGITSPNISVYTQAGVKLSPYGSSAGNTAEVQFLELASNGTNKVSLKAPDSLASDVVLTLPVNDGASGDALKTDGNGVMSWGAVSSTESMIISASDELTSLTVGTGKTTFRMPYAFTLTAVKVSLTNASCQ